jgi:hypothetical protein
LHLRRSFPRISEQTNCPRPHMLVRMIQGFRCNRIGEPTSRI